MFSKVECRLFRIHIHQHLSEQFCDIVAVYPYKKEELCGAVVSVSES